MSVARTLLLGLAVGLPSAGLAQGEIRGRVLRDADRSPVVGAAVSITELDKLVESDSLGRYALIGLSPGRYAILVRAPGFDHETARVVILAAEVVVRDFTLRAAASVAQVRKAREPGSPMALLRGRVVDPAGMPISYARIDVGGVRRLANDSGEFSLGVKPPKTVRLDIRRIGFKPSTMDIDVLGDTTVPIILEPSAQLLTGATIVAARPRVSLELSGFYRRAREREKGVNLGTFLTEEDIERRSPHRITQMFEGIPLVRVVRAPSQQCANEPHDLSCTVPVGRNGCPMTVFVDGRRLNSLAHRVTQQYARGLDVFVLPTDVAGIEVYATGTRAPPEYQALVGHCGVILIWTK